MVRIDGYGGGIYMGNGSFMQYNAQSCSVVMNNIVQ